MTGVGVNPLTQSVLYPRQAAPEASPRAISGRTSYHLARLAFHSYPQVIRGAFSLHRFGPPPGVTLGSPCPGVARQASGLPPPTKRPIRTRFRYGFGVAPLSLADEGNSPARSAKSTPSGPHRNLKKRGSYGNPPTDCRLQVSGSFHPPPGVLFTFPSRYWFTIGRGVVFSLGRWSARIPSGFPVPRGTREPGPRRPRPFAYGAITLYGSVSQPIRLERGFVTP